MVWTKLGRCPGSRSHAGTPSPPKYPWARCRTPKCSYRALPYGAGIGSSTLPLTLKRIKLSRRKIRRIFLNILNVSVWSGWFQQENNYRSFEGPSLLWDWPCFGETRAQMTVKYEQTEASQPWSDRSFYYVNWILLVSCRCSYLRACHFMCSPAGSQPLNDKFQRLYCSWACLRRSKKKKKKKERVQPLWRFPVWWKVHIGQSSSLPAGFILQLLPAERGWF